MLSAGGDFASSTAGYITGIGFPTLCAVIGGTIVRLGSRLTAQDKSLSALAQSVAILVSEMPKMNTQVSKNTDDIVGLREATAILMSAKADHDLWAAQEKQRIHERIDKVGDH